MLERRFQTLRTLFLTHAMNGRLRQRALKPRSKNPIGIDSEDDAVQFALRAPNPWNDPAKNPGVSVHRHTVAFAR
jgi:hypothetical protein